MTHSITLNGSLTALSAALTAFAAASENENNETFGAAIASGKPVTVIKNETPVVETPQDVPSVDVQGLPWDDRIHSNGRNKLNADGTWRKKRGVDDTTYNAVVTELRAANAGPVPVGDTDVAQIQTTQIPPVPTGDTSQAPAPQAPAPQAPAPTGVDFGTLMSNISAAMGNNTLNQEILTEITNELGISAITDVMTGGQDAIDKAVAAFFNRGLWV